ncbi:MAG TPA: hypothetical protein VJH21_00505 [Candidatus Paceibacterota bacterium]
MNVQGALHLHSVYSYDAKLTLSELKKFFVGEGLSFALMTEHTDDMQVEDAMRFIGECRSLSDKTFVFVPGFEVPYKDTHILMIGANTFFAGEGPRILKKFKSCSVRAVLAHPHKHGFGVDDTLAEIIDGVEIWNSQYDGKYAPRTKSVDLFNRLRISPSFHAFAGWDLHRIEHAGGPTLNCKIKQLTEENILSALRHGEFTINGRGSILASNGSVIAGGGRVIILMGNIASLFILLGKRVNALLAYFGVHPPRFLRRLIRRVL